ncbi:MAG: hypothetical protein IPK91_16155 [Saprospiraceae bacterium]|jgi:hypothetical protein|nr:hypothetical protein [Saprospiraceae bacterium]MBK8298775.1 hypothetical protein [Saprospiraceae bacterium]
MRFLFFIYVCLFLTSCVSDTSIKQDELIGKWIVIEALRNNKKTNTLEGAFFYFDQHILTTNFMGGENQAGYQLTKNVLQLTKGMDYTFHLERTPELGVIVMKTKIQKTEFLFKLKKE